MRENRFCSVSELLAALHDEEAAPTRFAVQFILVGGLTAWRDLVTALRAECVLVLLSERCPEEDLFPYLGSLLTDLESVSAEKVLLLPLGELLHLAPEQTPVRELASWVSGAKRVYVPILERPDLLAGALDHVGRYRSGECVVWGVGGEGPIDVHAVPFSIQAGRRKAVHGLRAYLELWEQGGASEVQLVSQWASSWAQKASLGRLHFSVSPGGYGALTAIVPEARALPSDWGDESEWRWLAAQADLGEGVEQLLGRLLHLVQPSAEGLLEPRPEHGTQERWLAWLWARSLPPSGSFADILAHSASSWRSLAEEAANLIFRRPLALQQLAERRRFLGLVAQREELPPSFWGIFETQQNPLLRLRSLPGLTVRQQEQIVREGAQLLRDGVGEEKWIPVLRLTFPALAAYLTGFPYHDTWVRDYLRAYTRSRLLDDPLPELLDHSLQWEQGKKVLTYPTRASVLHEQTSQGTQHLWVDALGIEWAGLLHTLLNDEQTECGLQVGRAELPTSTFFNREWSAEDVVERELDNLAHAHGYAQPRSLVSELHYIAALADRIRSSCQTVPQLVVTGDHGLTRFAASGERVKPPEGFTAHQWGRYAQRPGPSSYDCPSSDGWLTYNGYLVLARHGLFQGGSQTGGEVHGGATLEEALVPILCVRKRRDARPTARLLNEDVRPDRNGRVQLVVALSAPIEELRLCLGGRIIDAVRAANNCWTVVLQDLAAGTYDGLLQYEGGSLGEAHFRLMPRGIAQDDMGLPDER